MSGGSISLLIDSPLRDLALAMRQVPTEIKREIGKATRSAGLPIWRQTMGEAAVTRIQQRALVKTAKVSVTAKNITFVTGGTGRMSSGAPVADLTDAAAWGMGAGKRIEQRSRKGTPYTRRAGTAFPRTRPVDRAVSEAVPRMVSLWVQTAYRTIHEKIEEVS